MALTLSPPYVPVEPDITWYSHHLVQMLKSGDESFVNVLLTGRSEIFYERIRQIIASSGVEFHHYGLKPLEGGYTTMGFKTEFIENLVNNYHPTSIVLFEDREEHVVKFRKILGKFNIEFEIIKVPLFDTYLPDDIEIELVRRLIENRGYNIQISGRVSYSAIFLDDFSRDVIINLFPPVEGWIVHIDHMTVALGPLPEESDDGFPSKKNIGTEFQLKIIAEGRDERAYALMVEGCYSKNKVPHITHCVHPEAKPSDSNFIIKENWKEVVSESPIFITGILREKSVYGIHNERKERNKNKQTKQKMKFPLGDWIKEHTELKGKKNRRSSKYLNKMDSRKYSRRR